MQGWKCKVYSWWCQRTYLTVMQMSFCRDGDANVLWCKCLLMGMSWCKCLLLGMSWCKCSCRYAVVRMSLLWVWYDANVHVGMSWCKCPIVGMPWCECLLGSMLWCECNLIGMQWCRCPFRYAMNANAPWEYAMILMLWCKHNLFKNSFYFQNEASTMPETKIFSNSIYYSWKVIFFT